MATDLSCLIRPDAKVLERAKALNGMAGLRMRGVGERAERK
jgi:hypothetical protein